jgi:hypothetical protein
VAFLYTFIKGTRLKVKAYSFTFAGKYLMPKNVCQKLWFHLSYMGKKLNI